MPWLYNPLAYPQAITLADGSTRNLPGKGKCFVQPSEVSGDIVAQISMGKIHDRGGDPATEDGPIVKEEMPAPSTGLLTDTSSGHQLSHDIHEVKSDEPVSEEGHSEEKEAAKDDSSLSRKRRRQFSDPSKD